ncbi:MAG: UDP-N-acetylmuramoyl-tripeptide--D-alanyl-D-alanine ligase [Prevotellaceae bacterium]|jgi:UDP-N-acetylmuramoyl-tripeptide--D-alanyl-D-alanine ligase|nr:UDP-N-acetylmuramoyl-tripeptide--D-alanyl-D-alanine ligase [Prevotellaceae bacterium]
MNVDSIYSLFLKHPQVTTDSRNCPAGSIFFALKGDSFNGNLFAHDAIKKGCSYAFVDEKEFADDKNIFYVSNSLETLQQLARKHRETLGIPVIGITGTNGKTTTKELIASVLQQKYRVLYTQGNLNNHIGVPLTLLRLTKEDELAVIEMGANHRGEIKELVNIALPDYGLITNIGKAHLEGFGSFEGVIKTKGELYDFLREHHKKAFVNQDNDILSSMSDGLDKINYGANGGSIRGKILHSEPCLSVEWNNHAIHTRLIGAYNFENVLAAIAVGTYFEVTDDKIVEALEAYIPQNNRSQFKVTQKNKLIIDAYNANPTSMKASLSNFFQMSFPAKIVILGDMKELGEQSGAEHRAIVDLLSKSSLKDVFLIGPCFKQITTSFHTYNDTGEFLQWLQQHPIRDAVILIKGSNSMHLMNVVDFL